MAATEDLLGELHDLTASTLADIIRKGVPIVNKETGEIEGYSPAPAPYIAAAIKFLKDNDISAVPGTGNPIDDLADSLPDLTDEEGLHVRH